MTDFEREDMELQAIMGSKFEDMSKANYATPKQKNTAEKPVQKPTEEESVDIEWHPVKQLTWLDGLASCAKWALTFGGLNMLIFYWQQAGLMAESIAVPCMWVCCALAGYGVGLNVWRWGK
jgi:hypothetical protein